MITVRQLIEKLQALPEEQQTLPVASWGCSYESDREPIAGDINLGEGCVYDDDQPFADSQVDDYVFLE